MNTLATVPDEQHLPGFGPAETERVLTLREAAEACNTTYTALRKRADRGGLRTVKRGNTRMVPVSELERVGLLPGAVERALQERVRSLEAEIRSTRLLTELAESELEAERDARARAEAAFHEQRAAARTADEQRTAAAVELERIRNASAGPLGPVRAYLAARALKP